MSEDQEMFFNEKVARYFAKSEQNEKNFQTASAIDEIATAHLKKITPPYHVADIFAGAHPDRYNNLFKLLIQASGKIDWVDYSPIMLKLAKEYLEECKDDRAKTVNFIHKTHREYLETLPDETLNLVLIKYSLDYVKNPETFFALLYKKMKKNSILISTITMPSNIIKSHSTNAKYFFEGKPIPEDQEIHLKDGDQFTIKFFKESGNPNSGLIENAGTTKHYFSQETILAVAEEAGFQASVADWKQFVETDSEFNLNVLVLKK